MTARVQTQLSSTAASPSTRNNGFRSSHQPDARSSFRRARKRKFQDRDKVKVEGSNEEILSFEIQELLSLPVKRDSENAVDALSDLHLPETFTEIELTVSMLSSTGDGLAMHPSHPKHVFIVPFSLAGDTVQAKVIRHKPEEHHSLTDFISIIRPAPERDDALVKCAYFTKCAGCQFQMLPYPDQLAHKTTILRKAYNRFSGLQPSQIPPIRSTIGSPMQYGYRTKLTPHFDAPPGARSARKAGERVHWTERPPIGFMLKNTRKTIDIEDCPIGTDAVRHGLKSERERIGHELEKYNRGSTLLLRENTTRIHDPTSAAEEASAVAPANSISIAQTGYTDHKTCITDPKGTSVEYVSQYVFSNPASAFFQNNNSILDLFTEYIRSHILPSPSGSDRPRISHLIDAYSGSGLFTITLSTMFRSSLGIDISPASIASALHNLKLNNLADQSEKKVTFIAADASSLFESITSPATETAVILDPPRKGCDEGFLGQLLAYRPERIVYVSCNVLTQARDIGTLVRGGAYELESLQGFDFFPQTGHVEGVAVLRRCRGQDSTGEGEKLGLAPEAAKEEGKVEGDLEGEKKAEATATLVPQQIYH